MYANARGIRKTIGAECHMRKNLFDSKMYICSFLYQKSKGIDLFLWQIYLHKQRTIGRGYPLLSYRTISQLSSLSKLSNGPSSQTHRICRDENITYERSMQDNLSWTSH